MGVHPCKPLETKRNPQGLSKCCSPARTHCAYSLSIPPPQTIFSCGDFIMLGEPMSKNDQNQSGLPPMNMTDYPHKLRSYYHNAAYQQPIMQQEWLLITDLRIMAKAENETADLIEKLSGGNKTSNIIAGIRRGFARDLHRIINRHTIGENQ